MLYQQKTAHNIFHIMRRSKTCFRIVYILYYNGNPEKNNTLMQKNPKKNFSRTPARRKIAGKFADSLLPHKNMYLMMNRIDSTTRNAFTRSFLPQSRLMTVQNMKPKKMPSAIL